MTKSPDTPGGGAADGAAALFAEELRRLRAESGSPPFRQMARAVHYAPSTLSEAVSGRHLPSESVVRAFALACGADPEHWAQRLAQAAAAGPDPTAETLAGNASREIPEDAPVGAGGRRPGSPGRSARRKVLLPAGCLALGLGAGLAGGLTLSGRSATPTASSAATASGVVTWVPTAAPHAAVGDGADPSAAGCEKDARLVDRAPVMDGSTQVGALDLLYSPHCGAGWARVYLYPGQPIMLGYVEVRASDGRESSIAYPLIKQVDDYTNVVVPPSGGCLGARAVVDKVGRTPMTAAIICQAVG